MSDGEGIETRVAPPAIVAPGRFPVSGPAPRHPTAIEIDTPDGAKSISRDDFYLRAVNCKKKFDTEELKYAWKVMANYKGVLHDWGEFQVWCGWLGQNAHCGHHAH